MRKILFFLFSTPFVQDCKHGVFHGLFCTSLIHSKKNRKQSTLIRKEDDKQIIRSFFLLLSTGANISLDNFSLSRKSQHANFFFSRKRLSLFLIYMSKFQNTLMNLQAATVQVHSSKSFSTSNPFLEYHYSQYIDIICSHNMPFAGILSQYKPLAARSSIWKAKQ